MRLPSVELYLEPWKLEYLSPLALNDAENIEFLYVNRRMIFEYVNKS